MMFFKHKLENEYLKQKYIELQEGASILSKNYKNINVQNVNLFALIDNDRFYRFLGTYEYNDERYIICIYDYTLEDEYKGKSSFVVRINNLCRKNFETFVTADIYIERNQMELVNLDAYYTNRGHGTQCVRALENYCRKNNISRMFGIMLETTEIGLDNLKHFYECNGFTITTNNNRLGFYKIIT